VCLTTYRCVDAEQPDGVVARTAAHDDGVAVEHVDDAVFGEDRAPLLTEPPPQDRGGDQHGDHDHGPGEGHPGSVPAHSRRCARLGEASDREVGIPPSSEPGPERPVSECERERKAGVRPAGARSAGSAPGAACRP
jgi:hypothetical protein